MIASGVPATAVRFCLPCLVSIGSDSTAFLASVDQLAPSHSSSFLLWETTPSESIPCIDHGPSYRAGMCSLFLFLFFEIHGVIYGLEGDRVTVRDRPFGGYIFRFCCPG